MTNIGKINFLLNHVEKKLETVAALERNASLRKENIHKMKILHKALKLDERHPIFDRLFDFNAINIAGIDFKDEDIGGMREAKYVQITAIAYEISETTKITKNISLGYYGKAEQLEEETKRNIMEFVVRWRYEKSFQHSDYYAQLLKKLH
jgi:hypothetical protein